MLNMQKESKHNFTPVHLALLQQIQYLFSRQNICTNNYFYKQMNARFQIPLYIVVEEKHIAQITNNETTIKEALQMCSLLQFVDQKTIRIIEFPTLKFSNMDKAQVLQIYKVIKEQNKKILMFEKKQENQIHLSLLEKKQNKELQDLVNNINKNIKYQIADLHSDFKIGIAKIKKLKDQARYKSNKVEKYSLDKPPGIFIRRAVETSSDQEDNKQQVKTVIKKQDKDKRIYRQKPIINQEDFPTLS